MKTNTSVLVKRMCGIGMFSALAYLTTFLCNMIPNVAGFLAIDVKDAVIAIASFVYGPIAAPIIAAIVSFVEFITISTTGPWGLLMNFVSSSTFSLVASLIYKYKKTFIGAIMGFALSTVVTTTVMILMNPIIVPLYSGVSAEVVKSLIPPLLLPFNFAKTLLNSAIAVMLYKPTVDALRAAGIVPKAKYKTEFNKNTVFTLIIGGVALASSLVALIVLFNKFK